MSITTQAAINVEKIIACAAVCATALMVAVAEKLPAAMHAESLQQEAAETRRAAARARLEMELAEAFADSTQEYLFFCS